MMKLEKFYGELLKELPLDKECPLLVEGGVYALPEKGGAESRAKIVALLKREGERLIVAPLKYLPPPVIWERGIRTVASYWLLFWSFGDTYFVPEAPRTATVREFEVGLWIGRLYKEDRERLLSALKKPNLRR